MKRLNTFSTRLLFVLFLIIAWSYVHAQESVLSSSSDATGTGGTASYSVGQVVYITKTGNGGIITEGIQQPYEILFFSGIEEKGITLECTVYPNPATSVVNLKIRDTGNRKFSYQLTDLKGILLQTDRITGKETAIPVENLVPATYLLTILENDSPLTVYKIIKR
jgi:hypothetical protein